MIWRIETETCLNCLQEITEAPHKCEKIEHTLEIVYPGHEVDTVLLVFTEEPQSVQSAIEEEDWDEI